jgi:hypothetical protein
MAWIVFDLDKTLIEMDPLTGEPMPVPGAVEAVAHLAAQGHRLTVVSAERLAPMPAERRYTVKGEIEQDLTSLGFPPLEVWTGTTIPAADLFIGRKNIPLDGDWNLTLAHTLVELEDRRLAPGPMPDDGSLDVREEGQEPPEGMS